MNRFLMGLGALADVFRPLEGERAALEVHLSRLRDLGAKRGGVGECESVADVVKRGGLVESMPALSSEHRREGSPEAWRLVFPQHHGERVKVYLGCGEGARMIGQRVIDTRRDYEASKARFERVVSALNEAAERLWNVKSRLEGVSEREKG